MWAGRVHNLILEKKNAFTLCLCLYVTTLCKLHVIVVLPLNINFSGLLQTTRAFQGREGVLQACDQETNQENQGLLQSLQELQSEEAGFSVASLNVFKCQSVYLFIYLFIYLCEVLYN